MGKHLRKLFSADQVKEEFRRYLTRQIGVDQASAMLKIRRRQFFKLLKLLPGQAREFFFPVHSQETSSEASAAKRTA